MTPDPQESLSGCGNPLLRRQRKIAGDHITSMGFHSQQSHHSQSQGGNKKTYACVHNLQDWHVSVCVYVCVHV